MNTKTHKTKYPIVDEYLDLITRARAVKDSVRAERLRNKANRLLSVMTAPAARLALKMMTVKA